MKRRLFSILRLLLILLAMPTNLPAWGQAPSSNASPVPPASAGPAERRDASGFAPAPAWERYQEIIQRNPFLRERSSGRRSGSATPGTEGEAPASFWTLRGVMLVNDQPVVLLEESPPGRVLRLRHGQSFALGMIQVDGLDQIRLVLADGSFRSWSIGQSISSEGELISPPENATVSERSAPPSTSTSSAEAVSPAAAPPTARAEEQARGSPSTSTEPARPVSPATSEILERLRARRQQELAR